jgi:aspartate carbamoyltransferase catalytic subunit
LLSLFDDVSLTLVSPDELRMPAEIVDYCNGRGTNIRETSDLFEGVGDADVIYMTRVQQERFTNPEDAEKHRGRFILNRDIFRKYCRKDSIVMHPLPRDSRPGAQELSEDLNDDLHLAIFRQTDNGIPVRMALFAMVLGVEDEVEKTSEPVRWFVPEHQTV